MPIIRSTHPATAFPGSDALAPPGSVGRVSNRQTEPLLRRKGVQALTMWELRKYNVDIACLSEVRIPESGHSVINVPGSEACYHLFHSGEVDNTGRHGVAIGPNETV